MNTQLMVNGGGAPTRSQRASTRRPAGSRLVAPDRREGTTTAETEEARHQAALRGIDIAGAHRASPSEKAVDCFAHGLAHLVAELGVERAAEWAAGAVVALDRSGAGLVPDPPEVANGIRPGSRDAADRAGRSSTEQPASPIQRAE